MALQHKSKGRLYRELKWKVEFDEYLGYIQGHPCRLFLKFHSGTHWLLGSWVGMLKGVDPRNVLIVGLTCIRSLLNMLFLSVHHRIP